MNLLLISIIILLITGLISACLPGKKTANYIGASGSLISLILCIVPTLKCTFENNIITTSLAWKIPYASFSCGLDPLSGFFLISVLILSAVGSVYGIKYMEKTFSTKDRHASWLWYNLLEIGMMGVLLSRNSIMFIFAWEIMSISSFFLVIHEHTEKTSRDSAWIYLIATHIGTFFIITLFIVLAAFSGSFELTESMKLSSTVSSIVFVLAIMGFGSKAGFVPFHIWLPEAHPAAPSHVSAVMSGIMIKMGIYGILRIMILQQEIIIWWGILLLAIGIISGFWGVVLAIAQQNLKRLLAYSSVENIGIIAMGLGLGTLGLSLKLPLVAILGFAGGILHVLNHSFFKGLLFLGAGSVLHETGSVDLDQLGGLGKKMPFTSFGFLIGSASISGLPPFNGFISEFLIYIAALKLFAQFVSLSTIMGLTIIFMLPLIGGLALACFTKAAGIIFLGESRNIYLEKINESPKLMIISIIFLALGCAVIPYLCPLILNALNNIVMEFPNMPSLAAHYNLTEYSTVLIRLSCSFLIFIILGIVIWFIRGRILAGKPINHTPTWDCGYCKPTPRMQYTGSSLTDPIVKFFKKFIFPITKAKHPDKKFFPKTTFVESETPDPFNRFFYGKIFKGISRILYILKWIQNGNVQLYILYITITLFILIIWELI